jgi:hypothetical protein
MTPKENKKQSTPFNSIKQPVFATHSVDLSVLINNFIATLPDKNWKILAVDPNRDKIVLIREVTE